jgi:hypothetical protein
MKRPFFFFYAAVTFVRSWTTVQWLLRSVRGLYCIFYCLPMNSHVIIKRNCSSSILPLIVSCNNSRYSLVFRFCCKIKQKIKYLFHVIIYAEIQTEVVSITSPIVYRNNFYYSRTQRRSRHVYLPSIVYACSTDPAISLRNWFEIYYQSYRHWECELYEHTYVHSVHSVRYSLRLGYQSDRHIYQIKRTRGDCLQLAHAHAGMSVVSCCAARTNSIFFQFKINSGFRSLSCLTRFAASYGPMIVSETRNLRYF